MGTKLGGAASALLDLARGLAANAVVLAHTNAIFSLGWSDYNYGSTGVAVFFLLSGFLISQSIIYRSQKGTPALSDFMSDRIARIYTPLIPTLLLIALATALFPVGRWGAPGRNEGWLALLGNLLLLNDYPALQMITHWADISDVYVRSYKTAEQFWTVAVEFWIYVFVGAAVFVFLLEERVRPSAYIFFALAGPVFIWNLFAGGGGGLSIVWLIGSIFGLVHYWSIRTERLRVSRLGFLLLALGSVALLGRIGKAGYDPYEAQTSMFVGMILFGAVMTRRLVPATPFFAVASECVASYSYSLYLVHNTILVMISKMVADRGAGAAILAWSLAQIAAIALYLTFERHHRTVAGWLKPVLRRIFYPAFSANAYSGKQHRAAEPARPTAHLEE